MAYISRLFRKYKDSIIDDYRVACKSSRAFFLTINYIIKYKRHYKNIPPKLYFYLRKFYSIMLFPRFLLSYKLRKIEKKIKGYKSTKIQERKGVTRRKEYPLWPKSNMWRRSERRFRRLRERESRGMTDGENRKRHRNRNLLLQITTSLRLLFLLLLSTPTLPRCTYVYIYISIFVHTIILAIPVTGRRTGVRIRKFTTSVAVSIGCLLTAQLVVYV